MADFYNNPTDNIKKLVPEYCVPKNYVDHYYNLQLYLRVKLILNKYIVY